MAAGLQLKFTNIAITSKLLIRSGPNLAVTTHLEKYHKNLNFWNPRRPPALFFKSTKNAISSKPPAGITPNLKRSLVSPPQRQHCGQEWNFWNPRWPPDAILKNTKNAISPKPFVRFSPNLNRSFDSAPLGRFRVKNKKFQNPRWPPVPVEIH